LLAPLQVHHGFPKRRVVCQTAAVCGLETDLSQMGPFGAQIRRQRLSLAPRRCDGKDFPQKRCRNSFHRGLSPAHKTLRPGSSSEIGPRHTADARRRHSDRFVRHREPHPEASARRNRPIRSSSAANRGLGTATSANWNTRYFACDTTLAPILISFSRCHPLGSSVVSAGSRRKRWVFRGKGANAMSKRAGHQGNPG